MRKEIIPIVLLLSACAHPFDPPTVCPPADHVRVNFDAIMDKHHFWHKDQYFEKFFSRGDMSVNPTLTMQVEEVKEPYVSEVQDTYRNVCSYLVKDGDRQIVIGVGILRDR